MANKVVGKLSPLITLMESSLKEAPTTSSPSHVMEAVRSSLDDLHVIYAEAQALLTGKKRGTMSFSVADVDR